MIHRRDQYQPISTGKDAKLVHTLGFEQCAQAYASEIGALAAHIGAHRCYLGRVLNDANVTIALFKNTQFIARAE